MIHENRASKPPPPNHREVDIGSRGIGPQAPQGPGPPSVRPGSPRSLGSGAVPPISCDAQRCPGRREEGQWGAA